MMKRIVSIVLVITMLFTLCVSGNPIVLRNSSEANIKLGDVNKDSVVDASDALCILQMAAGLRGKSDIYSDMATLLPTSVPTPSPTSYDPPVYKPVIYLYPETETEVFVKLDFNGVLTSTYPTYSVGWNVVAKPDGKLYDKETDREYYCLFWEGIANYSYDFSEGFVVAGNETEKFLEDTLKEMGLTDKEANEFIIFWLPKMENNKYNLISFQDDDYTENAKLDINPEPDSILRVFMAYRALEEPIEIETQELKSFERVGFTVVEWGGSDCSEVVVVNDDNTVSALKLGDVNKDSNVTAGDALLVLQIAARLKNEIYLYPTVEPTATPTGVPTMTPTEEPIPEPTIIPNPTYYPCPAPEKPVIYLYPEEDTEVSVNLEFNGKITSIYPAYKDGWKVLAKPDGTLCDLETGREYYCLFWDGIANHSYDFSKGFVVAGNETKEFLENALDAIGLTAREVNEFIIYWLPRMEHNKYNLISFQEELYTDNAKLSINPEPDSVLRVFMAYKAIEEPIDIEPQEFETFERKDFTVVEWGGADCTE